MDGKTVSGALFPCRSASCRCRRCTGLHRSVSVSGIRRGVGGGVLPSVRLPVLPSVRCDRLAMRPSERQVSHCVVRRGVRGGVLPVRPSGRCDRLAMRTSERQVSLCVVRRGVRGGVLPVLPSVRCDRLALRRRNNSCHAVSSLIMRRVFRQQTPRAAPRTTLSKQSNRPALKTSVSPA